VDRALNGRPGINSKTREKIQEAARKHNYRPHLIASSLSRGKSMSIGVVLFDLNNRYFSQLGNTISLAAREKGYFTYISVSEKDPDSEMQILQNLAARRVDGIILLPSIRGDDYISWLKSLEIPIVTTGNHLPGIHHVSIDEFSAARESARYISEAGYRRICFICPPLRRKGDRRGAYNIASQEQRAEGFLQYMKERRDMKYELILEKDFSPLAASIVQSSKEKPAFFCSSDIYALNLLKNFHALGIPIPEAAGIMGFDNLDILAYINPRITTVSTSIEAVGEKAMDNLLALIAGEQAEDTCYVPHQICPGETL
jgi:DNA-binding LacI/PurR family transcriptional regulator